MSTFKFSQNLRFATLGAILAFATLGMSSQADAQRRVARQGAVKPARAATKAKLTGTTAFKAKTVGASLQNSLRGKTLMVAPKNKTGDYAKAMKHSVEVLFMPNASSYGHILVRVGNRMYDMPGPGGARKQNFTDGMRWVNSHAYGFVYARTESQITSLQQEFEAFANAGHGFSMAGGGPTKFSCAGFVTAALKKHAPELGIGLSVGAISAANRILRSGKHDAVTLYGSAANEAGKADFKFLKLQ
jgi:hypothetical protein